MILRDAYLVVNSVNLSAYVKQVELNLKQEMGDNTAMGATGRTREGGLKDEGINVTWRQNYGVGLVDATLSAIYSAGTAVAVEIRPTSSAVSTSNPKWTGSILMPEYTPISGEVGDVGEAESSFVVTGVLTRATA